MRKFSLTLAATALVAAPVLAQSAPQAEARDSAQKCTSSLQKVEGSQGYKLVSSCPTTAGRTVNGTFTQRAFAPVENGSSLVGGTNGDLILGFVALLFGGIGVYTIFDDDDNDLPNDGDGGVDPASP